ncbi:sensor histidine kinase [Kordia zhangzhouensis]|uniref:sensor histidine kinase n=1 Tax=Kordia zhangzhouensis TaxID=1620405 RepID=UPI000629305E|nr:sensor histidine kinase [Kordia zhangzhouensis]
MYKIVLFLAVLGVTHTLKAQDNKVTEAFVAEVFNIEYKAAGALATYATDADLRLELQTLANTMYYAGQEENYIPYTLTASKQKTTTYCVALLNQGFDQLYHHPNEVDSFEAFFEAYTLSKTLESIPLQKLCLYGILEFYHFQYSLTHEQYVGYLEEFNSLASSPIENCWYLQYKTYLALENIYKDLNVTLLIEEFEKATKQLPATHKFLPLFYSLKAVFFETKDMYRNAKEYHQKVLAETELTPHTNYLFFRTHVRLAYISLPSKEFDQGLNHIEEANNYIDRSDSLKSQLHIENYKAVFYKAKEECQKAHYHLEKSIALERKTNYVNNNIKNSMLESELQVDTIRKALSYTKEKTENQATIIIILAIVLSLGSVIALLYYRNSKRKQRIISQQLEIEAQKLEKAQREQEIAAIDAMILGQEREREAIASDLHDNVCALLSAAKMQFEHLNERKDTADPQKIEALFGKTKQLLENAYDEVHAMAYQKNSGVMAKKALLPAIENLIQNSNGINGIVISLQHHGLEERLESTREIFIFRIIQELIANVIKHAQATRANVSITVHQKIISVIVEDNGVGISEVVLLSSKGMGIRGIQKRILAVGGKMNIDTFQSKGTSVVIEIPR